MVDLVWVGHDDVFGVDVDGVVVDADSVGWVVERVLDLLERLLVERRDVDERCFFSDSTEGVSKPLSVQEEVVRPQVMSALEVLLLF